MRSDNYDHVFMGLIVSLGVIGTGVMMATTIPTPKAEPRSQFVCTKIEELRADGLPQEVTDTYLCERQP